MLRDIYLFNPQNDLALATGGINYVAPPFAVQMSTDLALIPAFIAPAGSLVITDSDLDQQWLEHLNSILGLDVHAVGRSELRSLTNYRVMPWGWCLDIRRRLLKWGASSDSVPSKDEVYHLRGLSHRRLTILIHLYLRELMGVELSPLPVELAVTEEVMEFVARHRECFIKTPWSSSGRGIYHTVAGTTFELEQWCRGALKRQGSLLCEVALDKMMDLGVEFYSERGSITHRGLSIFTTDSHCQYSYGTVASSEDLRQRIKSLYPQFDDVVKALGGVLERLVAPHYAGWLGVDMLLYKKDDGTVGIDPCVEMNLRPTMGAVASALGDTVLKPGAEARFTIEHRSSTSDSWRSLPEPVIEEHRLMSGALLLTPPHNTSHYRAVLELT